jgi:TP901 family phage tail tape measure protein
MSVQVASVHGLLSLRDNGFSRGIENAKNEMQGVSNRLKSLGGDITRFGGAMSIATAPIAVGLVDVGRRTQTFQRQMSNIQAITGDTNEATAELGQTLISMGADSIHGPQNVANAFYDIVSGVADSSTHMAILENAMSTAAGGQADLQATTSALISTMNSYGFAAEDAGYVSDVFTRTVGMGVLTMDELATAMPQVTGLASQFGVGLDEAGGSMAYLTSQGFSASQSATYMKSMISTLLNPTTQLAESISGLGYESGQALLEGEGLVRAYRLLAEQNGTLAGLITNQEALTGSLVLTGDAAGGFLATYTEGIEGATAAAVEIQSQTAGWEQIGSTLEGIALTAGMAVAPALNSFLTDTVQPLASEFLVWAQNNPEATKTLMGVLAAAVIAGPALMVFGGIVSGVGSVISLMSGAASGAAMAFGFLISPAGVLALAIAGIIGAAEALYPGGVVQMLLDAAESAKILTTWFGTHLKNAVDLVTGAIRDMIRAEHERQGLMNAATGMGYTVRGGGAVTSAQARAMNPALGMGGREYGVTSDYIGASGTITSAELARFGVGPDRRAGGGPVSGGTPYIVGERGEELFVPSTSGSIVNNDDLQGMGGIRIGNITINANSASEGRAAMMGALDAVRDRQRVRGGW